MTAKIRRYFNISEENAKKLERLSIEQDVAKSAVVDEALTLLFLPPLQRPPAVRAQQIRRREGKLDRLDAGAA
ncbi:MAG: hypothetical protein ACK4NV_06925, partial [Pannonibacter sp.]